MSTEKKSYGRIAFEAYSESMSGLTFNGAAIPPWNDVTGKVQQAWNDAARAVLAEMSDDLLPRTSEVHIHVNTSPIPLLARLGLPRTAEG